MNIKQQLTEYYVDREADFDRDETRIVLDVLNTYNENLDELTELDGTILMRMIDDDELYDLVDNLTPDNPSNDNPFD